MTTSRLTARLREIVRPGGGRGAGAPTVPANRLERTPQDSNQSPADSGFSQPSVGSGFSRIDERDERPRQPRNPVEARNPAEAGSHDEKLARAAAAGLALDARAAQAAAALGGHVVDTDLGPCIVIDRSYDASHRHGRIPLGDCVETLQGVTRGWHVVGGLPGIEALPLDRVVFLDLETTGLAGGAGTHAFLVGCAWFEEEAFRIRQFFMLGHALERALLQAVSDRFADAQALITYNGKTFDVPVLETRFLFHRQAMPALDRPHLDMLHPARRLWRGRRPLVDTPGAQSESCSLGALERVLFGVARYRDVPGFEIPTRYFGFLRSGNASPLEPVLEHNRLDLISLAAVTARAFALADGCPDRSSEARECLGMARLFDRASMEAESRAWFERALALTDRSWHAEDAFVRCEALRALAVDARRSGRHGDAVRHWEAITRMSRCPAGLLREALQALAIHHEHRSRDLTRARAFAQASRRLVAAPGSQAAIDQRLARIDRKLVRRTSVPDSRPGDLTLELS